MRKVKQNKRVDFLERAWVISKNAPFLGMLCLALSAFFQVEPVSAKETQEEKLEELVVTATKQELEAKLSPQPVNVIKKEALEQVGYRQNLRDLLLFEPGLQLTYHGGTDRRFVLRGMSPDKVLILRDGKRIEGRLNKDFEVDMLGVEGIERIEILKGPASALYGSDALGGVINIITKEPLKPEISYSARYGVISGGQNPESKNLSLSAYTGRFKNFNLGVFGRYVKEDPFVKTKNYLELTPKREVKESGVKLLYYLDREAKSKIKLEYDTMKYDHFFIYPLLGRARRHYDETERNNLSLGLRWGFKNWTFDFKAYKSKFEAEPIRRALNGTLEDYDYFKKKLEALEAHIIAGIFKKHRLSVGGDWRKAEYTGTLTRIVTNRSAGSRYYEGRMYPLNKGSIKYYSLFLQDEWFPTDKLFFVFGLRYDDSDKLDNHLTPRVGLTYLFLPDLRFKINYAQGFRNPSIEQLYYRIQVPAHWIWGIPNLKSEKSQGFDVGIEKDFGKKASFKINLFYQRAEDFIGTVFICRGDALGTCQTRTGQIVPNRTPYYEYANIEEAKFSGLEFSALVKPLAWLSGRLTYAYLEAKDEKTDTRLDQRPRHKGVGEVSINPLKELRLSLVVEHTSDLIFGTEEKDYTLIHLSGSYKWHRALEFYGGVANINHKKD
ncbi:MAG: TonB-dependent receptor, partial [Caldimicrobium sp.]|nr:TonB-dependent receptor [Caldimicrobium sp.]